MVITVLFKLNISLNINPIKMIFVTYLLLWENCFDRDESRSSDQNVIIKQPLKRALICFHVEFPLCDHRIIVSLESLLYYRVQTIFAVI